MDSIVSKCLSGLTLGKIQSHENMTVFPLVGTADGNGDYLTLKEAIAANELVVTEIGPEGSVPELKVINKGKKDVIVLDGEELAGAKQNRILNVSILIKKKAEIVVPVSCTEQGRWAAVSDIFEESGNIMATGLRSKNVRSVSRSLESTSEYRTNQQEIWDTIHDTSVQMEVVSRTGAMSDVYRGKKNDLDAYFKAFEVKRGQKGLFVLIDAEPVGFDYVSSPRAFGVLFPKLVKSYALEAMLRNTFVKEKDGKKRASKQENSSPSEKESVTSFLEGLLSCSENRYESVGEGWNFRYQGEGEGKGEEAKVVGSALVALERVLHMAFFAVRDSDRAGSMASTSRRRAFRMA